MDVLHDPMRLADWLAMSETEQEDNLILLWETFKRTPRDVESQGKSNFVGMLDAYRGIDPDITSHRQFGKSLFNLLEKRLAELPDNDEKSILEILYDIGKWQHSCPEKAREIVTAFLESHDKLSENVVFNAKRAKDGTYLHSKLRDTFVEKIERAFADVPYPEDGRIVDDRFHCYECEDMHNAFVDKQWQSLTDAVYLRHHKEMSILTPAAFRYFLPAYMRAAVVDPVQADLAADYIVYSLTPPSERQDEIHKANEMKSYRKLLYTDEQRVEKNKRATQRLVDFNFNREQIEVICDYIWLDLRLYEFDYEFASTGTLLALEYWQEQLESTL
ncbi:MAG: hypothetical protein RLP44_05820 [Aggregatilineales bacterium]